MQEEIDERRTDLPRHGTRTGGERFSMITVRVGGGQRGACSLYGIIRPVSDERNEFLYLMMIGGGVGGHGAI